MLRPPCARGPAGRELRHTLETQVLAVLRSPDLVAQLAASGVAGPKGAGAFKLPLDAEFRRWPAPIPKLGIKPEHRSRWNPVKCGIEDWDTLPF